jgi:Ser/Thr protein kinase RdoA (MazF antagonist)
MRLSKRVVEEALRNFGVSDFKSISVLPFGCENLNFKVEARQGPFVLRQWNVFSLDNISFECSLMWELKRNGFPVPRQFAAKDGKMVVLVRGKRFGLFEFLGGKVVGPEHLSASHLKAMGRMLGKMQAALKDFSPQGKSRSSDLFDFKFDYYLLKKSGQRLRSNRQFEKLKNNIKKLRPALANVKSVCTGPIHNDFFCNNLKFKDGGISAVLDFGDSCIGGWVSDLAATLSDVCFDCNFVTLLRAKKIFLAYAKEVELTEIELKSLPKLIVHRALRVALFNLDAASRLPSKRSEYLALFNRSIERSKELEEALFTESLL